MYLIGTERPRIKGGVETQAGEFSIKSNAANVKIFLQFWGM